jgi:hypothetical protein
VYDGFGRMANGIGGITFDNLWAEERLRHASARRILWRHAVPNMMGASPRRDERLRDGIPADREPVTRLRDLTREDGVGFPFGST